LLELIGGLLGSVVRWLRNGNKAQVLCQCGWQLYEANHAEEPV